MLSSRTLSERSGRHVALKAENLQRTGSFKLRGALAKIAALGDACAGGVVAAAPATTPRPWPTRPARGACRAEVFMPEGAPIAKVEAAKGLGATRAHGRLDRRRGARGRLRAGRGDDRMAFVHPFEDPAVIAGQGTLGLELLEQVPDLARVIVPVGGGGLISGVAIALKSARPEIEVIGVQVDGLRAGAGLAGGRASRSRCRSALTIADGIAVKRPGELTLSLIERWVDEMVAVEEDEVAEAMVFLLERAKLVVEGAGAVGVAALLSGRCRARRRPTGRRWSCCPAATSTPGLLAEVARRHESQAGRRLVLLARLPDRPGSLARLLALVGEHGANLLDVEHIREGLDLHVRETAVQLVLETRGSGARRARHRGRARTPATDEPRRRLSGSRGPARRARRSTRLCSSASGCHCTPSTNRRPGASIASGRSSSAECPVTSRPSPRPSTP